jgi:recombinational DNA repair ATPase RecF
VLFDGHPVADTASRGEVRTVVLALKILELKLIEAARSGSSSDSSLGFGSGSSSNLGSSSSDDQAHGGHTQGQTQSGAKSGGQAPLLLLDDVFSELDGRRRHALTDYLAPYQTFITTTDADLVLQHFAEECHVIPLS